MLITEETIQLEQYINKTWSKFITQKEVALRDLFPKPENRGLWHIWTYGSADLVVFKDDKPICIFEPGGGQHFKEKQHKNDARKFKLLELNKCKCLHMMNNVVDGLSKRQLRRLIGGFLWKALE